MLDIFNEQVTGGSIASVLSWNDTAELKDLFCSGHDTEQSSMDEKLGETVS